MKLIEPSGEAVITIDRFPEVRFTPSGMRMAVVYTTDGGRYEVWDERFIDGLYDLPDYSTIRVRWVLKGKGNVKYITAWEAVENDSE